MAKKYQTRHSGRAACGMGTDGQEGFKSAAKELSKRGDNAEKRRQSAMVKDKKEKAALALVAGGQSSRYSRLTGGGLKKHKR